MTTNFNKLVSDADFSGARATIKKRGQTLQVDVHRYLYAVAEQWVATGDVRPVVSRINDLIADLPKGIRINAVKQWVHSYLKLALLDDGTFGRSSIGHADIDLGVLKNKRWFEDTPEPEFKPIEDADKLLQSLLSKFKKDRAKLGDKSAVPSERIIALEAMLSAKAA